jgi:hypothetical protein
MKATMQFKLVMFLMFFSPQIYALEANIHEPAEAIDFIEMLGEMDDDDVASLEAAMAEIELKKGQVNSGQAKTYPQEMKK